MDPPEVIAAEKRDDYEVTVSDTCCKDRDRIVAAPLPSTSTHLSAIRSTIVSVGMSKLATMSI